jgi:hypothetical protein
MQVFGGFSAYRAGGTVNGVKMPNSAFGGAGQFVINTFNADELTGALIVEVNDHYSSAATAFDLAIGPRFQPRRFGRYSPFVDALIGVQRFSPKGLPSETNPSYTVGAGVDVGISSKISIRPLQVSYVNTLYTSESTASTSSHFNGIQVQAGLVYHLQPISREVFAECSAKPTTVDAGVPVRVEMATEGFPSRRNLSYGYFSNGGKIAGNNTASASVDTTGLAPGRYKVTANVEDKGKGEHHKAASCEATFTVTSGGAGVRTAAAHTPEAPAPKAPEKTTATAEQAVASAAPLPTTPEKTAPEAPVQPAPSTAPEQAAPATPAPTATEKAVPEPAAPSAPTPNQAAPPLSAPAQTAPAANVSEKHPPTLSVAAAANSVTSGRALTIKANGKSADNRPLNYHCTATAGTLTGKGPTYTLKTTGVGNGTITVDCTVSDDRERTASARASVKVIPGAKKFGSIEFRRDAKRPTRVDNMAKAELDRYADALAASPDARGVVVGYATAQENAARKAHKQAPDFAAQRAVNTKDYLSKDKGIDPARIQPRAGNGGKTVKLWVVPADGAFSKTRTKDVDESKVKAIPRVALKKKAAYN